MNAMEIKRMRVLIVHAAYQQRGGEDAVVEAEEELLRAHGHEVRLFKRDNKMISTISRASLLAKTLWSAEATQELATILDNFKPDVVHVHNTFPLISPAIYWTASKASIPIVQTLHNFRLLCPQAMFLRDGKICQDCLGKVPWRAITRACYRGSVVQSGVLSAMVTFHRSIGTWDRKVTRYIALNQFCREKFIQGGIPSSRIVIKPNFVDYEQKRSATRSGLLFVGRLSVEKGIDVLLEAARKLNTTDVVVRVAGSGSEAGKIIGVKGVVALGALTQDAIKTEMSQATALVLPSIWYENFPRTLVEAFASGLPVIASRIGALAELVEDRVTGLLFEPGDPHDLAKKMIWALEHPEEMAQMGDNSRQLYENNFTAEHNYKQLIAIYRDAIAEVRSK